MRIKKQKNQKFTLRNYISVIASVIVSFFFVFLTVYGATTISNNIVTDGTLSVTGASTLTGAVSVAGALNASSTFEVTGKAIFYNVVSFRDGVGASSTVSITGSTTIAGMANFGGIARFGYGVGASTSLAVDGLSTLAGFVSTASSSVAGAFRTADVLTAASGFVAQASSTVNGRLNVQTSIGIATSTPGQELGVTGDISVGSTGTTTLVIYSTTAGTGGCIELRTTGSGGTGAQTIRIYATSTFGTVPIPLYAEVGNCQ